MYGSHTGLGATVEERANREILGIVRRCADIFQISSDKVPDHDDHELERREKTSNVRISWYLEKDNGSQPKGR